MTRTNAATREIIRGGLDRSPMHTGVIDGAGPRYCPSVEDKIVQLQQSKRELAEAIISANESLIRSLSSDDLQMLFT